MAYKWEVHDKTFLISGGASGLGAAYVEGFLKEGAKNVAILDVAEHVGKATAERLNKTYPGKVVFIKCDVSNESNIESSFNAVLDQYKRIDVIINNAGMMVDAPSFWRTACDVNWQGLVSFTMKGIKHMSKEEGGVGGTIVNISSTLAITKFPFLSIYSGAKMAVLHFSQCLSMGPFYEKEGIRILTVCFGPTDTPLRQGPENRTYDAKLGHAFVNMIHASGLVFQTVESALAAFVYIFKNGQPGSIWLSTDNNPAKDITPTINRGFEELGNILLKTK